MQYLDSCHTTSSSLPQGQTLHYLNHLGLELALHWGQIPIPCSQKCLPMWQDLLHMGMMSEYF